MRKTFLIARREYLAFVRTVGFWLSIFTFPLLIASSIFIPLTLEHSAPPRVMNVAVLDLSQDQVGPALSDLVRKQGAPPSATADNDGKAFLRKVGQNFNHNDEVHLVPLPAGLTPGMTVDEAEARIPAVLDARGAKVSAVLMAYDKGEVLQFHIWSTSALKGDLEDMLLWDLHGMQYYKLARARGVDPVVAHDMREARADIVSLSPAVAGKPSGGAASKFTPRFVAIFVGYASWMAIFSSSMILLSSVIEEKASKVLEVLLASASTSSILVGKVLGVALVMLSVWAIWGGAAFLALSSGLSFLPPNVTAQIGAALHGMFSLGHIVLLLAYFVCGYLMYGVTFAAIGSFCETPKDAQAIMGPLMIVLMIPMLTMQAAFVSTDIPVIRYMSYFPLFTPFLMPLRLAQPLPWWEIAATLAGMGLLGFIMVAIGGKAFKQGALTGGKLSWGLLFKLAARKA